MRLELAQSSLQSKLLVMTREWDRDSCGPLNLHLQGSQLGGNINPQCRTTESIGANMTDRCSPYTWGAGFLRKLKARNEPLILFNALVAELTTGLKLELTSGGRALLRPEVCMALPQEDYRCTRACNLALSTCDDQEGRLWRVWTLYC
jgi:hypothetical protein